MLQFWKRWKKIGRAKLLETLSPENDFGTQNKATREVWLKKTLAGIPPGWRILDAGAGELQYKRFCKHLDYVSQDFAQYDGKGDGAGLQRGEWDQSGLDIVSDITQIPERDGAFDVVMCIEVLEHLPDPIAAIREFARLLKRGGKLILTAPFCSLTHLAPYHYYTGYNTYFFEKWLPENDFEIVEMERNGSFFEYIAQELRRIDRMTDIHCSSFTMSRLSRFLREAARRVVLSWLSDISEADQCSDESLCFGLHVLARKR